MNKIESVLDHLEKRLSITTKESLYLYGYSRLSDGILKLRNRGHGIVTIETLDIVDGRNNEANYGIYCMAEKLEKLKANLKKRGIKFYIKKK